MAPSSFTVTATLSSFIHDVFLYERKEKMRKPFPTDFLPNPWSVTFPD